MSSYRDVKLPMDRSTCEARAYRYEDKDANGETRLANALKSEVQGTRSSGGKK